MLIIQGIFRSGTTTLFRALRQDERRRCYYEPLHPDLLTHAQEAAAKRPSHRKSPLYAEYQHILETLRARYRADLAVDHAMLNASDDAHELRAYLEALAHSASPVVLQFNRAFWMSRWLHTTFPDAGFIHIVRDPRSVVWSQLTTGGGQRVRMELPLIGRTVFNLSSGDLTNVFSSHAYHGAYHVKEYFEYGCGGLGSKFDDEVARNAHAALCRVQDAEPYVQALALWGAQVRVCREQARSSFGDQYHLVRYEDLCTSPSTELRNIYDLDEAPLPPSVQTFAEEEIHDHRMDAWTGVNDAGTRFRRGIERAGIRDLMDDLGYSLSPR